MDSACADAAKTKTAKIVSDRVFATRNVFGTRILSAIQSTHCQAHTTPAKTPSSTKFTAYHLNRDEQNALQHGSHRVSARHGPRCTIEMAIWNVFSNVAESHVARCVFRGARAEREGEGMRKTRYRLAVALPVCLAFSYCGTIAAQAQNTATPPIPVLLPPPPEETFDPSAAALPLPESSATLQPPVTDIPPAATPAPAVAEVEPLPPTFTPMPPVKPSDSASAPRVQPLPAPSPPPVRTVATRRITVAPRAPTVAQQKHCDSVLLCPQSVLVGVGY
jgi:hypothetical protein